LRANRMLPLVTPLASRAACTSKGEPCPDRESSRSALRAPVAWAYASRSCCTGMDGLHLNCVTCCPPWWTATAICSAPLGADMQTTLTASTTGMPIATPICSAICSGARRRSQDADRSRGAKPNTIRSAIANRSRDSRSRHCGARVAQMRAASHTRAGGRRDTRHGTRTSRAAQTTLKRSSDQEEEHAL
jgi:hypothetical protein